MTLWLGNLKERLLQLGRGHTHTHIKGDTVVCLPQQRILFAGDPVDYAATPLCWGRAPTRLATRHPDPRIWTAQHDRAMWTTLETPALRARHDGPVFLSRTHYRHAFWTLTQWWPPPLAGGFCLTPGVLLGTGTPSGDVPEEGGCQLELSAGGREPIALPKGEERLYREDGDRALCALGVRVNP